MKQSHFQLRTLLLLVGIVLFLWNIIFTQSVNSIPLLFVTLYWIVIGRLMRLNEKYFFLAALILLILTPFPLLAGYEKVSEKLAVWWYLFMVIALVVWFLNDVVRLPRSKKPKSISS